MKDYRELAEEIVNGDVDFSDEIMDFLEENDIFDAEAKVDVITKMFETFEFPSAEELETSFLDEIEQGEGVLINLVEQYFSMELEAGE